MAAQVAHEIRSPLGSISLSLDLIGQELHVFADSSGRAIGGCEILLVAGAANPSSAFDYKERSPVGFTSKNARSNNFDKVARRFVHLAFLSREDRFERMLLNANAIQTTIEY